MYYNSITSMSKYLINSSTRPEVNGYYISNGVDKFNEQLLYKKELNPDYQLYYDTNNKTWNLGLKSNLPIFTAVVGSDVSDPYLANWNMKIIIVKICGICGSNCNLCNCSQELQTISLKATSSTTQNNYVIGKCSSCGLYVCCCNIENSYCQDVYVEETCDEVVKQPAVVISNVVLDKQLKVFTTTNKTGWYTISSGAETTWGEFRLEYSSGNSNRYGYISFTLHKNVYSKEIVLNILEQRQYYNDSLEIGLNKNQYIVFTDLRIASDANCISYIQVKYNELAYKNGDIVAEIVMKNKYDKQWKLVDFDGPNLDSKYTKIGPTISIDVIEAKIYGENKLIYNTDGNFGLNVDKPQRTLDINGSVKITAKNNYQSSTHLLNDLLIYDNKFQEKYQTNQAADLKNKLTTSIKFLKTIDIVFSTKILSSGALSTTALLFPTVNIGDHLLFLYTDANSKVKFISKTVVSRDTDKQLILDSNVERPTGIDINDTSFQVDVYHILKNSLINYPIDLNSNKKLITATGGNFQDKFVDGDKVILLFEELVITKQIQRVIDDDNIEFTEIISQTLTNNKLLGIIPIPSQFVIANNEGKSNIMVDNKGSLVFTSNQPELNINAIEMSVEKGKMEILSSTAQPNGQPSVQNYNFEQNFLKLAGNLKVHGQTKFTDHLFVCNNQPELSEPDITALIDSEKGDLRLKGTMVSNRVVSKDASMVQITVNNLLSKTHSTWSDKRLKKDIVSIEDKNILEKIKQLNPVKFKWKENEMQDMGFIAQEIKAIFPEAVEEHQNGYLHIHYNRLMAYLVMAMKQLNN